MMPVNLLAAHLFNEPVMLSEAKFDTLINLCLSRQGVDVDMSAAVPLGNSENLPSGGGVMVIPVTGTLTHRPSGLQAMSGLCSYQNIDEHLDAALSDDKITDIVLDINSHGGMVAGAFDQAERIYQARQKKRITAIVNEAAYSAAFLMASAASRIVVPRTAGVGSIGVIAHHVDRSEANAKAGIRITPVFAGDHKADLSPDAPLSEAAHQRMQASVNDSYALFVDAVARYRGLTPEAVRATQAGLYRGQQAVDAGLADEVNDAKTALAALVKTTPNTQPKRIGRRAKAIQMTR